jgi:hypothetical protein
MRSKQPNAVALLERARPDLPDFDPDAPAARALLDDILAAPPAPPRPRRRSARRLAVVAATAGAAGIAVMLAPLGRGSPDVIARAAAALNDPGTILHLRAEGRVRGNTPGEEHAQVPDERIDHAEHSWQTAGARQIRVLHDDGSEFAIDFDARTALAYDRERNALIRSTDPRFFDPARRPPGGSALASTPSDDLAPLVERARNGDPSLSLTGETAIRGIPVYELRVDRTELPDARGAVPPGYHRLIYVDRERFLPVRVVEGAPGGVVNMITDYLVAERLPRTPENERLLRLAPHPGAERLPDGPL